MPVAADRRETIRAAVAAQLRLPPSALHDGAALTTLGLDSLALAQAVVAVEEAVGAEVDTETLSLRLSPEMTVGALVEAVDASLAEAG